MRLESIIWALIGLSLVIGVGSYVWSAQVDNYGSYMNEVPDDPFSNYSSYISESLTAGEGIREDVYNASKELDPTEGFWRGALRGVKRVFDSVTHLHAISTEMADDLKIESPGNRFFTEAFYAFLAVSAAFGLIYLIARIRSWS